MQRMTVGIASTSAAIRTQRFCQIAAIQIVKRARVGLDRDNPVTPEIER